MHVLVDQKIRTINIENYPSLGDIVEEDVDGVSLTVGKEGLLFLIDRNEGLETVDPEQLRILSKYKPGRTGSRFILSTNEDFGIILD